MKIPNNNPILTAISLMAARIERPGEKNCPDNLMRIHMDEFRYYVIWDDFDVFYYDYIAGVYNPKLFHLNIHKVNDIDASFALVLEHINENT